MVRKSAAWQMVISSSLGRGERWDGMEQRVSQSANAFADVVFLRVSVADLIAWWREEHADVSPAAADSPDVIKPKKEVLLPLPVSNEA